MAILLIEVEAAYPRSQTPFHEEAARRLKTTPASEKSAFYRLVREGPKSAAGRERLRLYADILGLDEDVFSGGQDVPTPETVDAEIAALRKRMDGLERDLRAALADLRPHRESDGPRRAS